jgi:hypothetical protein
MVIWSMIHWSAGVAFDIENRRSRVCPPAGTVVDAGVIWFISTESTPADVLLVNVPVVQTDVVPVPSTVMSRVQLVVALELIFTADDATGSCVVPQYAAI